MADTTLVNGQVTDAVTQTGVQVTGEAPGTALTMVYQMMAQAVGLAMQNAVAQQQHLNAINNAVTAQAVNLLLNMDPAAAANSAQQLANNSAVADQLNRLQAAIASNQTMAKTA